VRIGIDDLYDFQELDDIELPLSVLILGHERLRAPKAATPRPSHSTSAP
jgi:hypothetical protein